MTGTGRAMTSTPLKLQIPPTIFPALRRKVFNFNRRKTNFFLPCFRYNVSVSKRKQEEKQILRLRLQLDDFPSEYKRKRQTERKQNKIRPRLIEIR